MRLDAGMASAQTATGLCKCARSADRARRVNSMLEIGLENLCVDCCLPPALSRFSPRLFPRCLNEPNSRTAIKSNGVCHTVIVLQFLLAADLFATRRLQEAACGHVVTNPPSRAWKVFWTFDLELASEAVCHLLC